MHAILFNSFSTLTKSYTFQFSSNILVKTPTRAGSGYGNKTPDLGIVPQKILLPGLVRSDAKKGKWIAINIFYQVFCLSSLLFYLILPHGCIYY